MSTDEEWPTLCKRANEPKLKWLEDRLTELNLRHGRSKWPSAHAPRLLIHPDDEDAALGILNAVDHVPDDDPKFRRLDQARMDAIVAASQPTDPKPTDESSDQPAGPDQS